MGQPEEEEDTYMEESEPEYVIHVPDASAKTVNCRQQQAMVTFDVYAESYSSLAALPSLLNKLADNSCASTLQTFSLWSWSRWG